MIRKILILVVMFSLQLLLQGCSLSAFKTSDRAQANTDASNSKKSSSSSVMTDSEGTEKAVTDRTAASTNAEATGKAPRYDEKTTGVINEIAVDVFRNSDIQSERVTQALYNQPVKILEEKDSWIKVEVVDGYTGWVKSKYIDRNLVSLNKSDFKYRLLVTAKTKKIMSGKNGGVTVKEVAMGTEVFSSNNIDNWYEVILPENKTGWIDLNGTMQIDLNKPIPKTTSEDFLRTLDKYKGVTYLWGGVSALGIDCSGLTYICSKINGVELPRDAEPQYAIGTKIELEAIKPGDLVFFSTNEDLKDISHEGVYIGNGQFIHASKSKGSVIITPLNDPYFQKRLVGIKRIF
jgi:cell wall-associated NlpC family hydrolase